MKLNGWMKKAFMYEVIDVDTGKKIEHVMEAEEGMNDNLGTYSVFRTDEKGKPIVKILGDRNVVIKQKFKGNIKIQLKEKYKNFKEVPPQLLDGRRIEE